MSAIELSKGSIAKFINGIADAAASKELSLILVQVLEIKEDLNTNPPTTIFVYLWRDLCRVSDGVNSCRTILKSRPLKEIKRFDVVILNPSKVAYIKGLYFSTQPI